jgi:large subunit ribosomal protein L29
MSTANELRQLKIEELRARAGELKQQIFDMKSKHNTGVLDSTADLPKTRREIARCLTVARESELGLVRVAKAAPKPAGAEKRKAAGPKAEKADKPAKKAGKAKE